MCSTNRQMDPILNRELGMAYPVSAKKEQDLDLLTNSVNPVRLKNNPVSLSSSTLRRLYEKVVKP